MIRYPLLIASLGNPPPTYKNTLHSAGHTILDALALQLGYPPFTKSRSHANGLISRGPAALLWQSPTLMNVSGPAVAGAWRTFLKELSDERRPAARLVVLHDDLESPLGKVKIKQGGSVKGHNGLKSCCTFLQGVHFSRVGVGIGRPESRDSKDVADYVLRKMTPFEYQSMLDVAGRLAIQLVRMAEGLPTEGKLSI
ncbi:MAG: hypothetical protein Q9163_005023 [Psora crenata]